ncbi:MAG: agmatine deiminase family protein [Verrucomicrobiae bacterium]|nr:agmatine deiminase family protein [Verrucomicrobiae bacterium]
MSPSPRSLGFSMPAEWTLHGATFLTWPREDGISFPGRFEPIPEIWARLTRLLAHHEAVHIHFFSPTHREQILQALREFTEIVPLVSSFENWPDAAEGRVICAPRCETDRLIPLLGENASHIGHTISVLEAAQIPGTVWLHPFPSYEPWCRDHGPIFLTHPDGRAAIVDWDYNAWGGKYPPYDLDDIIPSRVAQFLGLPLFTPGIIMEGGALDTDGEGTLLTTKSCLLNPNRNPTLSPHQIETYLRDYLGIQKVLWLGEGIEGDDTDGHVDDLTRFVAPGHVVTAIEENPHDPNYLPLTNNYTLLQTLSDARSRPLRITTLPMPKPRYIDHQRLPASYANFYIANRQVIVPIFRDPADDIACSILAQCFPDRTIVPFDATDLIWGLGAIHCITQQMPRIKIDTPTTPHYLGSPLPL